LCGENLILSAVGTVTADLKAICLGFLSILGMCFFMANASNSAQMCLANEPGDSEAFGQALAVSKDYLAVGDPKANRVVLYQRNSEKGSWSRVREILPPKGSATEKAKAGFGYALDLSGNTLIVGAYDWIQWSQNSFLGAVYVAKIGTDEQVSIQEVVVPSNVTVGYSLSLFGEEKIAFAGSSEKRSNERLLIANLPSGKISSTSRRKYSSYLSGQRLSLISPLKRLGHGAIEVLDKRQDTLFKLSLTGEAGTPQ
jgi:hypothetical protein